LNFESSKKANFVNMLSTVTIIKYALIIFLLLSSYTSLSGQTQEIDTTDYLLPTFDEAIDFNLIIAASKGYSSEIDRLIKKVPELTQRLLKEQHLLYMRLQIITLMP